MSAADPVSSTVGADGAMAYVVLTHDKNGNPQLSLPDTTPAGAELSTTASPHAAAETADSLNLTITHDNQPSTDCSGAPQVMVLKSINVGGQQMVTLVGADDNPIAMQQGTSMLNMLEAESLSAPQGLKISNVHSLQSSLLDLPTMAALTPSAEGEEPLYVNAKQYHRILKRREARARLEARGILSRSRPRYQHESRHRHAARRIRGPNGKFLSKEEKQALLENAGLLPLDVSMATKMYESDAQSEEEVGLLNVSSTEQLLVATLSQ